MNERKIMGLAAGQARLLTITGRKSDCEFESMRLSHQKIALARELADLSNQYQDSLDYTKLVYDYYGTGDTKTPLSYGICMNPSILNDYMPITLTDSMNRVVLDSKYAAAAQAAGIPQEGLGILPSETVRNAFVEAMGEQGIISTFVRDKILALPYNQNAGLGGGATVSIMTESGPFNDLLEHLRNVGDTIRITTPDKPNELGGGDHKEYKLIYTNDTAGASQTIDCDNSESYFFSLSDLLEGKSKAHIYHYNRCSETIDDQVFNVTAAMLEDIIDQVGGIIQDNLCLGDDYTANALRFATQEIKKIYCPLSADGLNYDKNVIDYSVNDQNYYRYIGWAGDSDGSSTWDHSDNWERIDIGNMVNAYLTLFADFMNGISATDSYNRQILDVKKGLIEECKLVSEYPDDTIEYVWKNGSEVSSDDLGQAQFYDTLFNQLCLNGWTENNNINDNDYLQKMLENGMMYVTKIKDDGYYYQGNYATDNYIKVVADERRIAAAEAKYNTEKAKLNAKEQTLDMKMKNLDTEISSLTTEYDTIKNTLSKNIERGFKRYSA